MWHEARKQEKKLRVMIVDYRKRAERRREFYEKFKADPTQFMQVHGRPSKIFLEPQIAASAENCMMPWQGNADNMIDRFDVRAHLDIIPEYHSSSSTSTKSAAAEEEEANPGINYERYRILIQNDLSGMTEDKFLHQIHLEEQFGTNATTHSQIYGKALQPKGVKAAIGYTYEDSTPAFSTAPVVPPPVPNKGPPAGAEADEESEEEIDFDLLFNVDDLTHGQKAELNNYGTRYGLGAGEFMEYLNGDLEEKERMRLAKLQEEEKQAMSGRKARRERRAYKDKLIMRKGYISPPSYATYASPADEEPSSKRSSSRSESRSRSNSPEKITFITSFGGNESDDGGKGTNSSSKAYDHRHPFASAATRKDGHGPSVLQADLKLSIKGGYGRRRSRSRSKSPYSRRRRRSRSNSSRRRTRSRRRSRSSSGGRRRRRHSSSSSRSRSRRHYRHRRRSSSSSSRSRSRSRGRARKRRHSSRSSRSRTSRSRSRSRGSGRRGRRKSRTRSRSSKRSGRRSRSRSRSKSRGRHRRSRSSSRRRRGRGRRSRSSSTSASSPAKNSKRKRSKSSSSSSPVFRRSKSKDPPVKAFDNGLEVVGVAVTKEPTPPPPPVRRYYGRHGGRSSSSESSISVSGNESDGGGGGRKNGNQSHSKRNDADELLPKGKTGLGSTSKEDAILPGGIALAGSSSSQYSQSVAKLTPKERLRRKMQFALSKTFRADKEAEKQRLEKLNQERMDREESLRELTIKYRRREREKRHRDRDDRSSSSSSTGSYRSRSRSPGSPRRRSRSSSRSPYQE